MTTLLPATDIYVLVEQLSLAARETRLLSDLIDVRESEEDSVFVVGGMDIEDDLLNASGAELERLFDLAEREMERLAHILAIQHIHPCVIDAALSGRNVFYSVPDNMWRLENE